MKDMKKAKMVDFDTEYAPKSSNPVGKVIVTIILILWTVINIFPIYFIFTFSLKSNDEIFGNNIAGLPRNWIWSNYTRALGTGNMGLYFLNSILVTGAAILISLIAALMATYAITRIKWRASKLANAFFMLGLTIPLQASIVPVFFVLKELHWLNKYSTLIIPYSAFALAMAILICTGFMVEIPYDLDEAARIDGCGLWRTFYQIILPLMKPAYATVGIYSYLQCWNEFMFANVFISDSAHRTLPIGIQQLSGSYTTDWGPIGAALVIATFPTLIFYISLSRRIQESFIAGAVKG
ncbi:MAG: carbohydrate ABC transporter permease [Lachnospiraceae bacterium]|nr:carbohydrate ABC transporter permease [Lachnospiraceae bacterium]